jgi:hypothetical protein
VFAVASIYHHRKNVAIDRILELLAREGFAVRMHIWKGLSLSVPQVRFSTDSTDVVIQVEDEDLSPDELDGLLTLLPSSAQECLRSCSAKLAILPFQSDASVEQYEAWLTSGIWAQVPRKASLDNPDVLSLAKTIGKALDGFVFDDTENSFVSFPTTNHT